MRGFSRVALARFACLFFVQQNSFVPFRAAGCVRWQMIVRRRVGCGNAAKV